MWMQTEILQGKSVWEKKYEQTFLHALHCKAVLLLTHFRLLVAFSIVPNELHIIPLHLSNAIRLVFRCMAWVSVLEQR